MATALVVVAVVAALLAAAGATLRVQERCATAAPGIPSNNLSGDTYTTREACTWKVDWRY